jgi:DNA-binding NtrC family response regulator
VPPHAPSTTESILIADGQDEFREELKHFYCQQGYCITAVTTGTEALSQTEKNQFDLILADVNLSDTSGLEVLKQLKEKGHMGDVILMSALPSVDEAVQAMSYGAAHYLAKPFTIKNNFKVVQEILSRRRREFRIKRKPSGSDDGGYTTAQRKSFNTYYSLPGLSQTPHARINTLIGQSQSMRHVFKIIDRIAPTNSSVLITGDTGTGKELVARAIHEQSNRYNGPFVDINCSAIPDTLIEAELFGHQRGSFTGANETRQGLFEAASGGTLFLDEVDALNLTAQAKLLRVLQERQLRRVGGRENILVDVRIIAATNRDLQYAVAERTFRADLLFRLCVVPIRMPSLPERGDDVQLLSDHLLKRHAERRGEPVRSFTDEVSEILLDYQWPGNVRELENVIEYALAMGLDETLDVKDLPPYIFGKTENSGHPVLAQCLSSKAKLAELERHYILAVLTSCEGNQMKTALQLGIDRRTLFRRLQQYGVESSNSSFI